MIVEAESSQIPTSEIEYEISQRLGCEASQYSSATQYTPNFLSLVEPSEQSLNFVSEQDESMDMFAEGGSGFTERDDEDSDSDETIWEEEVVIPVVPLIYQKASTLNKIDSVLRIKLSSITLDQIPGVIDSLLECSSTILKWEKR